VETRPIAPETWGKLPPEVQAYILVLENALPPTLLECIESVDMMRVLEHGGQVQMLPTEAETLSVDTPGDLERVVSMMAGDRLIPQYLGRQA